jgi:hypothetical protein
VRRNDEVEAQRRRWTFYDKYSLVENAKLLKTSGFYGESDNNPNPGEPKQPFY